MTRGGKDKNRSEPDRRCIATGESQPKGGLIRFVVGPEDTIYPDLAGKLPGRGIYVAADRDALKLAIAKKLFSRGAKKQVNVPDGLLDLVQSGLLKRTQDTIALARKSGRAVCGYEKVRGFLYSERTAALIQATDGSERGKTKLSTPEGAKFIGHLSSEELGLAFGRGRVIHAAVSTGELGKRVVEEAARLHGIRNETGGNGSAEKDTTNA